MADWKSIPDLEPSDGGVAWNTVNTTKASLVREFLNQKEKMTNIYTKEDIFKQTIKNLMKHVELCQP